MRWCLLYGECNQIGKSTIMTIKINYHQCVSIIVGKNQHNKTGKKIFIYYESLWKVQLLVEWGSVLQNTVIFVILINRVATPKNISITIVTQPNHLWQFWHHEIQPYQTNTHTYLCRCVHCIHFTFDLPPVDQVKVAVGALVQWRLLIDRGFKSGAAIT